MTLRLSRRSRSAFTLIELLIVIAIIALLIGILLPAIGGARKTARMTVCMSNMRNFAIATASYAAENRDKLFNYSWTRGTPIPPDFARFLPVASQYADNDMHGAAMQFTYIMQRRLNLTDPDKFATPEGWFPYVHYAHIPLLDYMSAQLPFKVGACPEDRSLQALQASYLNVDNAGVPVPPISGEKDARWRLPFRLSYTIHSAHYSPDKTYNVSEATGLGGTVNKVAGIVYAANGFVYLSDNATPNSMPMGSLANKKMTDIRFPSQKTWMSDDYGRHFGRKANYFADPQCRQPLAFYDNSIRVFMTGETNPGWMPDRKSNRESMTKRFSWFQEQSEYDPPIANATTSPTGKLGYNAPAGWFQMTRGGLRGWDVPRGGVRSVVFANGTMSPKVENELDTTDSNAY
ncbi:MAG: type II secretion system protein [Phycisphaerales bacterium]